MSYGLIGGLEEGYWGATRLVEKAILHFVAEIERIAKLYPNVGIGDTATDEAITTEIYKLIHTEAGK